MGVVVGHERCPACEAKGQDRSGDNLAIYEDGSSYCWKCSYTVPSEEYKKKAGGKLETKKVTNNTLRSKLKTLPDNFEEKRLTAEKIKEIEESTVTELNVMYRGLQRFNDVIKRNGFRFEVVDGEVTKMYSPCYYFDGTSRILTGYNVRTVDGKKFHMEGFVSPDYCEWHGKSYNSRVAETLIIVGGQVDYVTTQGVINELMKKYPSHKINVVSPVNGENSTYKHVVADYEWVTAHKKIILALDNDEAGITATEKLLEILPSEQVYLANFGELKDPNSYRLDNTQLQHDIYWSVQPVDSFGIVGSSELFDAAVAKIKRRCGLPLPYYMKDMLPFVPYIPESSIVLFAGETSGGKTTLLSELQFSLIMNSGHKTGILSFEDDEGQFGIKVANRVIGTKLQNMDQEAAAELMLAHRDKILKVLKDENGSDRFKIVTEGFSDVEQAKKVILKLIKVFGCKVIVIDPLQNLIGSKTNEVQRDFMLFLEECKRIYEAVFILGTHIRKVGKQKEGKDPDQEKGAQYTESDIEGSGSITKSATLTLAIFRDKTATDEVTRNTTTIAIFKNREFSDTTNFACKVFYRKSCHRLYPYSVAEANNFFLSDKMGEVYEDDIGFKLADDVTFEEFVDGSDAPDSTVPAF